MVVIAIVINIVIVFVIVIVIEQIFALSPIGHVVSSSASSASALRQGSVSSLSRHSVQPLNLNSHKKLANLCLQTFLTFLLSVDPNIAWCSLISQFWSHRISFCSKFLHKDYLAFETVYMYTFLFLNLWKPYLSERFRSSFEVWVPAQGGSVSSRRRWRPRFAKLQPAKLMAPFKLHYVRPVQRRLKGNGRFPFPAGTLSTP